MTEHPKHPHEEILRLADQCVKCGLCLPHCPTYAVAGEESEGPRGRISLLQGLALEALEPDPRLQGHLDRCLGCRACEAVCPARVDYGALLDLGQQALEPHRRRGPVSRWAGRLGLALVARPARLRRLAWLPYAYRRLGLQALVRRSRLLPARLARLERLLPALRAPRPLAGRYPQAGAQRGRVALFTGCVTSAFDRGALNGAVEVLTALGFEVEVPAGQGCCGALHLHAGDATSARRLARRNTAAFADAEAVLYLASGCGAELQAYDRLLDAEAGSLPQRAEEVSSFITRHWSAELKPRPLPARATVHDPCTLRNVVRGAKAPYRLLELIPELNVTPLPGNSRCCGAAGSYMLTQPEMADRLRQPKLDAVADLQPQYLLTSNIGCALHLGAGLGNAPEVLHPVELLARQLEGHIS